MLLDNGADYVIVTDEEDLPNRVIEITNGQGANLIFDYNKSPKPIVTWNRINKTAKLLSLYRNY